MSMTSVVWTYDTFENNLEINHRLEKYFNESSSLDSDEHFSFKFFLKFDFVYLNYNLFMIIEAKSSLIIL